MIQLVAHKNQNGQIVITTDGLASTIQHPEIRVEVHVPELRAEAESFLRYVSDYVAQYPAQIRPGETLAYGYWLVKFKRAQPDILETWEYNAQATDFVQGADLALTYWRDQHETCEKHHAAFQPPRPDRLTVVSKGVLEGFPVQGVRYPSPEYLSGWWITTDQYDGNVKSLKHEHTYHITAARPELAKYLALPEGFASTCLQRRTSGSMRKSQPQSESEGLIPRGKAHWEHAFSFLLFFRPSGNGGCHNRLSREHQV